MHVSINGAHLTALPLKALPFKPAESDWKLTYMTWQEIYSFTQCWSRRKLPTHGVKGFQAVNASVGLSSHTAACVYKCVCGAESLAHRCLCCHPLPRWAGRGRSNRHCSGKPQRCTHHHQPKLRSAFYILPLHIIKL